MRRSLIPLSRAPHPVACPLAITILLLLPMLTPAIWQQALEYQRPTLANRELWRLVTGHLVHLGWGHFGMNLLGFLLIWQLFLRPHLTLFSCFFTLILLTICTSCGLFLFSPEVAWYRGLSGVLHGWLIWALLQELRRHPVSSGLLLSLLVGKLAWEQLLGPVPGSEAVASGQVIVDAHLYGAIAGALLWGLETYVPRRKKTR